MISGVLNPKKIWHQ